MASSINEDCTMEIVMKNIYTSCDPDNSNLVPVSKLIDFVTPYMIEDLSALESLRDALDPQSTNVCVSSEKFYEVMNEWTKKIANSSDENNDFNRTPSQLEVIDDKHLPYTQSTPRASFGQKLLSCEGLLNLSNVSSYSLSTSMQVKENNTVGAETTILEEEVKRLEHHLNRVSNEMMMVKLHLTATEEQNEILQADLDRCKTRLHSEQQIIEHLQNDKRYNDELREELNSSKKQVEELNKKVIQYEKDNIYLQGLIEKTDKDNTKLEQRCEELSRREQDAKKQIIDIKTELDLKDQEITTILKINEELKVKLNQQRDIIDQLTNENELLDHKKNSLEKALKGNISARRESIVSQYKTCLADSSSFPTLGIIPIYSPPSTNKTDSFYNSPEFVERVLSPVSPNFKIAKVIAVKKENLLQKVLKSSTPKTAERPLLDITVPKELQGLPVLSPTISDNNSLNSLISTPSLPTMYYIERSNVVQDQSSEDECYFKIQETEFKNFPHESLRTEISQVSLDKSKVSCSLLSFENNEKLFEFDEQNKHFNDIVERYLDEINELKVKNEDIQTKLDIVNGDNEVLCLEVTTMKEKIVILEQDLSNILTEKKMKEENLEQIQLEKNKVENELKEFKKINSELKDENNNLLENNKSINNTLKLKDTILTELEEKLLSLKREFTNLHMENISKEKELFEFRNKFNFETAYKNIQIELNEKNKDLLEIAKSNEELKELLGKITNSNQELQKSLKQAKLDLKENQDKSKEMLMLNENIEQTASQVQVHIDRKNVMINELVELNRKFESNIGKLQEQLQDKIKEVTELRDCLKSDMEIKNMMWRDNKELKLKLDNEHKTNEKLSEELQEIQNKIKEEKEEYSSLRFKYDQEADRNCELCAEILAQKEELSLTFDKYNKEISENRKLYEKVSTLRNEIDVIKESQKECKMQINNKLSSYDDLIKKLEVKLQELRVQNDTLKIELESEKNKPKKDRFFDAVVTSSEIGKNRSFEKQTMKIDRLKEKLDITEQQLQNEKIKNDQLGKIIQENDEVKEKYAKIQVDFAQAESKNNVEKQELKHKIKDLSEKLRYQSENYIKLENIVNEKETVLSLKLSQIEQQNQHLYAELTNKDCIINNIYAEMETYKNANKIAQELSTKLSAKLFELNEKEKEIHYINAQVAEKNNNILSLTSKIRDQEIQLTKALDELTENKNINFNLEEENRKLQEMLSISDNLKEKDLTETEQKLKSTCRLLQCSEMELSLIEKKLTDAKMEFDCISTEISEHKDMICHGNFELSRAASLVLSKWEDEFEQEDIHKELSIIKECEMEDNLYGLSNKIKFAVSLLEILANKAPISMEESDFSLNGLTNVDNNTCQCLQSTDGKTVKKFTLRPPRLIISRPVSPDSPSIDIDAINNTSYNEVVFNTLKESYINQNLDKSICQDIPYHNEDSYTTACDELSFCQFQDHYELTAFQDSFINVSDTFLEKQGLHESNPKQNLTKAETEELFTTFAIQIALDSKDIKERLQKQKERCNEQQQKFLALVKDISTRLRDHKCIGATDPISPVFVLLEDMKYLLKDITQSTGQFGVLTCENRMMKCWNLVTNYMALLKQDVTNLELLQFTGKQNDDDGTIHNLGDNLRKRLKNLNKKGNDCETSVLKNDAEVNLRRCKYVPSGRFTIMFVFFLIFLILILLVSIHWQCRMTAPESQVCVLDDFIKKIQVGNPPY